jgi:hypothetical protein
MKKKKILKTLKPDFMRKNFIHDPNWKNIYKVEDYINDIISEVYHGKIIVRCEIEDLYVIRIQFKIDNRNYEYLISKRYNDFGFSIFNLDDDKKMYEDSLIGCNKTIINNKFYLYNIYKIIFNVIGV